MRRPRNDSQLPRSDMRFFRLRPIPVLVALLAIGLCAGERAGAQTSALEVLVVDREAGKPLEGARILIPGTSIQGVTDRTGHVLITGIEPRPHAVQISRLGYGMATVTVTFEAE